MRKKEDGEDAWQEFRTDRRRLKGDLGDKHTRAVVHDAFIQANAGTGLNLSQFETLFRVNESLFDWGAMAAEALSRCEDDMHKNQENPLHRSYIS